MILNGPRSQDAACRIMVCVRASGMYRHRPHMLFLGFQHGPRLRALGPNLAKILASLRDDLSGLCRVVEA